MISFDEARAQILGHARVNPSQSLPLLSALGHVTSHPLVALLPLPTFDNSAVDGYGVRLADVESAMSDAPVSLSVQGIVYAGDSGQTPLSPGHTIRVMTGAPIPPGVEAVVMQECVDASEDGTVQFREPAEPGENIRCRGEEFAVGDTVLPAGTRVTPPVLGVAASLGVAHLPVYPSPQVALVVTGSELVPPGESLGPGQIYESNAVALQGALKAMGIETVTTYWVKDDPDGVASVLQKALEASDVVLTTGGVSVGQLDLVKPTWEALGVETQFWKVAIKPGKPFYFGVHTPKNTLVFGLPGNPVAALLTFKLLVAPALQKMRGEAVDTLPVTEAILSSAMRQKPGRLSWVRASLAVCPDGETRIEPVRGQGSHMMGGLAQANALLPFGAQQSELAEGDLVKAVPLAWQGGY